MLSFSSQLNVARTKAVPIPLCHPTPCSKAGTCRNSFVCRLCARVWGLGGHKGTWRTPAASIHNAFSVGHNQVLFPLLTHWICFQSQVRLVFSPQTAAKPSPIISAQQQLLILQEPTDNAWRSFHTNYHVTGHVFQKTSIITNVTITATLRRPQRSRISVQ